MSNRELKRDIKSISTLESDSPVDLYWLHRQNVPTSAGSVPPQKEGEHTIINEMFWDDFVIVSKAVKLRNPEATVYDAFNFIREHMLGGWSYVEDSPFMKRIDEEVEREYRKEQRKNDSRRSQA